MNRRSFFLLPLVIAARDGIADVAYGQVERGVPLRFPRDHGSHPAFRTEWWYVTGLLRESAGAEFEIGRASCRERVLPTV